MKKSQVYFTDMRVHDEGLAEKLEAFRRENSEKVLAKDKKISEQYSTK